MAVTHVEVESDGADEGALVVCWELEGEADGEGDGAVDIAVGPTPEAIDHAHALTAGAGQRSAVVAGLAPGRHYVSVAPHGGGGAVVAAERRVSFEGVTNFRDLGGYRITGGGRIRWGRIFRSDGLHKLTPADLAAFERLGLRVVLDLRGEAERGRDPNPVASRPLAIVARQPGERPPDPGALRARADGERWLRRYYLGMLAHSGPLFGQLLSGLAEPDGLPAVFHCTGGKDRTGMTAALLLTWLGVDREAVLDDYQLTARWRTLEHQQGTLRGLLAMGMSREAALGFLGAPRWVMADALAVLDEEHGGIGAYLRGPAGMSPAALDALRRSLVG